MEWTDEDFDRIEECLGKPLLPWQRHITRDVLCKAGLEPPFDPDTDEGKRVLGIIDGPGFPV